MSVPEPEVATEPESLAVEAQARKPVELHKVLAADREPGPPGSEHWEQVSRQAAAGYLVTQV